MYQKIYTNFGNNWKIHQQIEISHIVEYLLLLFSP